jgi:hypothetical protein
MGEVVRFIPKSERERSRLIEQARALYDSIFPPAAPASEQRDETPASNATAMPIAATRVSCRDHDQRRALVRPQLYVARHGLSDPAISSGDVGRPTSAGVEPDDIAEVRPPTLRLLLPY